MNISGEVGEIGEYAFKNCKSLEIVRFNKGLKCINDNAFLGCIGLREIYIPKEADIHKGAFKGCRDDLKIIRY